MKKLLTIGVLFIMAHNIFAVSLDEVLKDQNIKVITPVAIGLKSFVGFGEGYKGRFTAAGICGVDKAKRLVSFETELCSDQEDLYMYAKGKYGGAYALVKMDVCDLTEKSKKNLRLKSVTCAY